MNGDIRAVLSRWCGSSEKNNEMNFRTLKELDCKNKRVLLRTAYDVPLVAKGRGYTVFDDTRIRASIPTIQYLLKNSCRIVIATWLGRPGGKPLEKYRLDPIGKSLSALLKRPVRKLDDSAGPTVRDAIERMKPKEIILLENVRFRKEEEKGDMKYGEMLASYGECVVFEAFPQAHRAVPSTIGLLKSSSSVAAGLNMQQEVELLSALLSNPKRPFVVILGGAKISDKIQTFMHLLSVADIFLVGGAMSLHFLKARGAKIGQSRAAEATGSKAERKKIVEMAESILSASKDVYVNLGPGLNVPKLMLPRDLVAADVPKGTARTRIIDVDHTDAVPPDWSFLDIGPATVERYAQIISCAKTIFWNGPLGLYEVPQFSHGSRGIATAIAKSAALSILGGGDTEACVKQFKLTKKMSAISAGGGASLEFLAGRELPVMKYLTAE